MKATWLGCALHFRHTQKLTAQFHVLFSTGFTFRIVSNNAAGVGWKPKNWFWIQKKKGAQASVCQVLLAELISTWWHSGRKSSEKTPRHPHFVGEAASIARTTQLKLCMRKAFGEKGKAALLHSQCLRASSLPWFPWLRGSTASHSRCCISSHRLLPQNFCHLGLLKISP